MAGIHVVDHPLVQHKISLMRDKMTGVKEFRELTSETAMLICYEATRDLPMKEVTIETHQGIAKTKVISGRKLAFVPILRAGLGLVDGVTSLIPAAKIGHIVIDAMLATGTSAIAAIKDLKEMGVKSIKFLCILACPEGRDALLAAHPDVDIYCGGVDESLNEKGYIVPGLGDAGDRIFGTK